jgi:ribose transport system substrate-binding protein
MGISLAVRLITLTFLLTLNVIPTTTFADNIPHHHIKPQFVVGFAQDTLANDWRLAQVNQLKAVLLTHANIKLIVTDAGGNSAKQIQDMENFAHDKVDLLITSPRDGIASTPAISRIYKQGIPVVLITRSIANNDYTSLITPDDQTIAAQAAKLLAEKLSGKGNILILQGVPSATTAQARTSGFLDEIAKYPGIKISAIKPANYLRSDAILATDQAINDGIRFDAIYAQSDSMASGARLALLKHGISPDKIQIVGIDYINEARSAIRSGQQLASFVYPTCATETAEIVLKILHGQKVPKKIKVPSQIVTHDNVDSVEPIF